MNELMMRDPTVTMSSLEIVDVINAARSESDAVLRHDDFLRKVPQVLGEIVARNFTGYYTASNGKKNPCYNFPRREATLMAMSYNYKAQAAVYDRMIELENEKKGYRVPQQPMPAMLPTTAAKITLNDLQDIGKMLGTPAHIVNTEAVKYISNTMHLDLTPLLAGSTVMDNIPNEDKMLEVTEIAKILGPKVSGMVVNQVLKKMGYQVSVGSQWSATQLGKPISTQHAWANGKKSGYNLKWNVSKVIEIYEAYCNV